MRYYVYLQKEYIGGGKYRNIYFVDDEDYVIQSSAIVDIAGPFDSLESADACCKKMQDEDDADDENY